MHIMIHLCTLHILCIKFEEIYTCVYKLYIHFCVYVCMYWICSISVSKERTLYTPNRAELQSDQLCITNGKLKNGRSFIMCPLKKYGSETPCPFRKLWQTDRPIDRPINQPTTDGPDRLYLSSTHNSSCFTPATVVLNKTLLWEGQTDDE